MTQDTETLWQIGQQGKGGQEFVQAGGRHAEFTYVIGSDDDPINQPQMPSLLVVAGRKTKQKRGRKELFATDKLNIQFTLTQNYSAGELTLFYNFFGSEVDTLFVDGELVTEVVGVGAGKPTQAQISLPALGAGKHTLTLTTAVGLGDGVHRIDYLKLDGVVVPQQSQTPKDTTMAKKKTATPELEATPVAAKKSYVPTGQTGLQDYSYWWSYVRENAKTSERDQKPFRRGRIWA
jgi:cyanobactin cluster PatC/TenC/TruC protein